MGIKELDWESQNPPGPATENLKDRRPRPNPVEEAKRGRAEELDEDAGDIADEGSGHRC